MSSWMVGLAVAWYRLAVRLRYPRDLRRRFGTDMVRDFETWARDAARSGGVAGLARTCLLAAQDLARPLPPALARVPEPDGPGAPTATLRTQARPRPALSGVLDDARYALRSLARASSFTLLLVVVAGIGIALNATAFSVVNAYLLRPLPYPAADRLVAVNGPAVLSWTEVGDVLDLAVSWDLDTFTLVGDPKPENVRGAWVTPDFLEAYAIHAALGRVFSHDEAGPGGSAVAMISHRLWLERFGADRDVIGRTFRAYMSDRPDEGEVFTVVGVLPADFWYVNPYTEVLVPIREERGLYAGRLRTGVSREDAEAYLNLIARDRLAEVRPDARMRLTSLQERYVGPLRPTLLILQVAALLVLLIACANMAVLQVMRAIRREREIGVRRALGAGRSRLARQLLWEGAILAGGAGLLAATLSTWAVSSIREIVAARLGRTAPGGIEALTVDGTVLGATVLLAAGVGVLFGLVPLLVASTGRLGALLSGGFRGGDTRARRSARQLLVGAEITLTLALLMGAGLLVRASLHMAHRDLGFDPSGVVSGGVGLRAATYPEPADRVRLFASLLREVRDMPDVESAALAGSAPFWNGATGSPFTGDGDGRLAEAIETVVSAGYFDALAVPVLRGRDFTEGDVEGAEPVAIVSSALAARLWPDEDPLGKEIRRAQPSGRTEAGAEGPAAWTVVGVVGDLSRDVGLAPPEEVYRPYAQDGRRFMHVLARARPGAATVVGGIEDRLARLDPAAPLSGPRRIEEGVDQRAAQTRFLASLMVGFAAFASLLAVLGLYGVIAYGAAQQRREIAIRLALGADTRAVTRRFVASGATVVATGIALGSFVGVQLGRGLESLLHGLSPWDPVTHGLLAGGLVATAMLAVWLPARRAARGDPMGVLRQE